MRYEIFALVSRFLRLGNFLNPTKGFSVFNNVSVSVDKLFHIWIARVESSNHDRLVCLGFVLYY